MLFSKPYFFSVFHHKNTIGHFHISRQIQSVNSWQYLSVLGLKTNYHGLLKSGSLLHKHRIVSHTFVVDKSCCSLPLGGASKRLLTQDSIRSAIFSRTGFRGCLASVDINGQVPDIAKYAQQQKVTVYEGCHSEQSFSGLQSLSIVEWICVVRFNVFMICRWYEIANDIYVSRHQLMVNGALLQLEVYVSLTNLHTPSTIFSSGYMGCTSTFIAQFATNTDHYSSHHCSLLVNIDYAIILLKH